MGDKVTFSGQHLNLIKIAAHYRDVEEALRGLYFASAASNPRFVGYTRGELQDELADRLEEEGQMLAMSVLAAVEAAFRIDYLQRVYERKKDPLSRAFRLLHKRKGTRAGLEDDILEAWRQNTGIPTSLISDLRSAFRFRHWLAHGRYWSPKFGRRFDYFSVHSLAQQAASAVPTLMTPTN